MEWEIPELVAFLRDNNGDVFKDVRVDGKVPSSNECCLENCELDHHNIYNMLDNEHKRSVEEDDITLNVSEEAESWSKPSESKRLLIEGEADAGAVVEITNASSITRTFSKWHGLDPELVNQKDNKGSWVCSISMATKVIPKEACCGCGKCGVPDSTYREECGPNSSVEDGAAPTSLASLFACQNTIELPDQGELNRSSSIHSSSTASTKSFAFPVLTTEWPGSPVRMAEAENRGLKERLCRWRMCFGFFKF